MRWIAKLFLCLVAAFALTASVCFAAVPKQSDDDLDRQILGVWQSPNVGDAQVPIYIHDTFKPDHSVTSEYFTKPAAKLMPAGGKPTIAHWEVEAGYVLIGKLNGHELDVTAKREIHLDAKGAVTKIADWTRADESKR